MSSPPEKPEKPLRSLPSRSHRSRPSHQIPCSVHSLLNSSSTTSMHLRSSTTRAFVMSTTLKDGRNRDGISYPICLSSSSASSIPSPERPLTSADTAGALSDSDGSDPYKSYEFSDDGSYENLLFPHYNAELFIDPSTVPDVDIPPLAPLPAPICSVMLFSLLNISSSLPFCSYHN